MIGLVDGNNFFVSCERVFNRRLVGRPVAVLSNNDGCCVSRSNEFKALGIPMGTPYFQLKHREASGELCFCSSNYELYGDMSRRIISILREEAVDVEQYSIDEAFIFPPTTAAVDYAASREVAPVRRRGRPQRPLRQGKGILRSALASLGVFASPRVANPRKGRLRPGAGREVVAHEATEAFAPSHDAVGRADDCAMILGLNIREEKMMDKTIDYAPPGEFFRRLRVKRRTLQKFGFRKTPAGWTYSEPVANGALTCSITVDANGAVTENTVDAATNEEYVQHRIAAASGKFVGGVRRDVMALMQRIADACFERDVFKTALARDILSFVAKDDRRSLTCGRRCAIIPAVFQPIGGF